jgi:hypothetical protein
MRHRRTNAEVTKWHESLLGREFGWLTILEVLDCRPRMARCRCRCGTEKLMRVEDVAGRQTKKSCGCKRFAKPEAWQCRVCKRTLPFTTAFFPTDRHNIHGLKWDCKDCDRDIHRDYCRRLKAEVLAHYGNGSPKCACCGEKQFEFLCLDHVNEDGKKDRQQWGLGTRFYMMLKRTGYPNHLQILCFNCNFAKSVYGVCPHQRQNPDTVAGAITLGT